MGSRIKAPFIPFLEIKNLSSASVGKGQKKGVKLINERLKYGRKD